MRNQPVPLINQFYADASRPFSMQDVCNWLPATAETGGTRTEVMLKTPPGLSPLAKFTTGGGEFPILSGPIRGLYVAEGQCFVTVDSKLHQLMPTGEKLERGTIPGVGFVRAAHNQITGGNEVMFVNGSSGYIWNNVANTFARIVDDGFPGAIDVFYIDGYFIGIEPGRRFAFISDLADGMSYNTLDRFTSEVTPDLLVGGAVSNNELLLLSEKSGEFFENTGASAQPFRSKRISFNKGCAGRYTIAQMDNTVFWLGNDGYFYALEGYAPRRISTRPIEQAIRGKNWAQASAVVWESEGHTVCYWTFPDGQTFGYDAAERKWHRRASPGLARWRVNTIANWKTSGGQNRWIAGDFQAGKVFELDWDYTLEEQSPFVSEMTGPVMHDNQNVALSARLEIVMDTGMAATVPRAFPEDALPPPAADDADASMRMQYADDGQPQFSNWQEESIGLVGEYGLQVSFTRLGRFRQRVYRLRCSSPRRRDLLGAVSQLTATQG